jgi:3-methylcrotonyl-CoA carboxylase alpha subunit
MQKAGVPVVPGYQGDNQDDDHLQAKADETGYPVLIKAVAGGGGKGMRRVDSAEDFAGALASCRREAQSAFGDARVLIERYVTAPRHIEVQVFADGAGNCVHLFERDCSMQRRHQKVIEEAPAPGMPLQVREKMCAAAVEAARAVGYRGAGTVEFIADGAGGLSTDGFFFMEMNTRLQVEHPVTEAITGVDLVEWQLRIAAGESLPTTQDELQINGHAVEARLYAEDPDNRFLPQTGKLQVLDWPQATDGLRIDTGVVEGAEISPFYDPMIAKVIFHGRTRREAMAGLARAIDSCRVLGVRSNLGFNRRLVTQDAFLDGAFDTGFIDQRIDDLCHAKMPAQSIFLAAEGWLQFLARERGSGTPWRELSGWSLGGLKRRDVVYLRINGQEIDVAVEWENGERRFSFARDDELHSCVVAAANVAAGTLFCRIDGRLVEAGYWACPVGRHVIVAAHGVHCDVFERDMLNRDEDAGSASASIAAPMSGKIIRLHVSEGQTVAKGEQLAVLEAMKMEHSLTAGLAGMVQSVGASEGDQVQEGQVIIVLASESED